MGWQKEHWQATGPQRDRIDQRDQPMGRQINTQPTEQLRAIRGATTVPENSAEAMAEAVRELLDAIDSKNQLDPTKIVSVTFSVTRDLDAVFPAAIARTRPNWDTVPLLDVQQMHVEGSLPRCIRIMLYLYLPSHTADVQHAYLRGASKLRPDLCLTSD